MDYISRKTREIFARIYPAYQRPQIQVYTRELTKLERYLQITGKILSWEDVSLTLSVFLAFNFIFWFTVQYEFRLFGAIFLLSLIGFVLDLYLESYELLADDLFDYFYDLRSDFTQLVTYLQLLRKDSPSFFSIGMAFMFIVISFIARNISGYNLCYLALLAVFFVPLSVMKLPPNYRVNFRRLLGNLASEKGVLAEDDLIPLLTRKDSDRESLLTDRTADSVTNSLISGIMGMPSHLDDNDLLLDEDDLLPIQKSELFAGSGVTPGDSDSDSEHKGISFSGNLSSSSEDDQVFAGKLKNFDEIDEMSTGGRIIDNLLNVLKKGMEQAPVRKSSSSDSDFEIINYEEQ